MSQDHPELSPWIKTVVSKKLRAACAWIDGTLDSQSKDPWFRQREDGSLLVSMDERARVQLIDFNTRTSPYTNVVVSDSDVKVVARFDQKLTDAMKREHLISFGKLSGAIIELNSYDLIVGPKGGTNLSRMELHVSSCIVIPGTEAQGNIGQPMPLTDIPIVADLSVTVRERIVANLERRQSEMPLPSSPIRSQRGESPDEPAAMSTQAEFGTQMPHSYQKLATGPKPNGVSARSMGTLLGLLAPKSKSVKPSSPSSEGRSAALQPVPQSRSLKETAKLLSKANEVYPLQTEGNVPSKPPLNDLDENGHSQSSTESNQDATLRDISLKHTTQPMDPANNTEASTSDDLTFKLTQESLNKENLHSSQPESSARLLNTTQTHSEPFSNHIWDNMKRVPRTYVRIPKNQRDLLDQDDAWFTPNAMGPNRYANIPGTTIAELQAFYGRETSRHTGLNHNLPDLSTRQIKLHRPEDDAAEVEEDEIEKQLSDTMPVETSAHSPALSLLNLQARQSQQYTSTLQEDLEGTGDDEDLDDDSDEPVSWDGSDHGDRITARQDDLMAQEALTAEEDPEPHLSTHSSIFDASLPQPGFAILESHTEASGINLDRPTAPQTMLKAIDQEQMGRDVTGVHASDVDEDDDLELAEPHSIFDEVFSQPKDSLPLSQPRTQFSTTELDLQAIMQVERTPHTLPSQRSAQSHQPTPKRLVLSNVDNLSSDPIIPGTMDGHLVSSYEDQVMIDPQEENVEISASSEIQVIASVDASSSLEQYQSATMEDGVLPTRPMSLEEGLRLWRDSNKRLSERLSQYSPGAVEKENDQETIRTQDNSDFIPNANQDEPPSMTNKVSQADKIPEVQPSKRAHTSPDKWASETRQKKRRLEEPLDLGFSQEVFEVDIDKVVAANRREFFRRDSLQSEVSGSHDAESLPSGQAPVTDVNPRSPSFSPNSPTQYTSNVQNIVEHYQQTYPDYTGSSRSIVKVCVYIDWLQTQRKAPHRSLWDDFIRAFDSDYLPYVKECESMGRKAPPHLEFYNEDVEEPIFDLRIITPTSIKEVFDAFPKDTEEFRAPFLQRPAQISQEILSAPTSQRQDSVENQTGNATVNVAQLEETAIEHESPSTEIASKAPKPRFFETVSQQVQVTATVANNPSTDPFTDDFDNPEADCQILDSAPAKKISRGLPWSSPRSSLHTPSRLSEKKRINSKSPVLGNPSPPAQRLPDTSRTPAPSLQLSSAVEKENLARKSDVDRRRTINLTVTEQNTPDRPLVNRGPSSAPIGASKLPSSSIASGKELTFKEFLKLRPPSSSRRKSRLSGVNSSAVTTSSSGSRRESTEVFEPETQAWGA